MKFPGSTSRVFTYLAEQSSIFINPPEAIWNLVTPVATPRSVRPGFFNPSRHTTVCQISYFSNTFCIRTSKAIPWSLRPGFFFNASGHTTICQTGFFFDILDLVVNDHTTVSQTGSVVWSVTSYVERVTGKKPGL